MGREEGMPEILQQLRGGLVVSCQAAPGDPLEDTETIRRIARSVTAAGAVGLRINSAEHIAAIRRDSKLPIIGIQKRCSGGKTRITPDFAAAAALAEAGASIIALDCTSRDWPNGEPWRVLIERIHRELNLPVMADIATLAEAPTQASGGRDAITASLCRAVQQVISAAHNRGVKPAGLGIASAGAIDPQDGSVFAATENLPGWAGFPLRFFAEERFDLATWVVNDAHAAVLAELHFGLGRSLSDFVAVTIGTGIGGGVVCGRKLLSGRHGFAGTIGHHVIREGGRPCNCGRHGCLEAYVSTAALIREYEDRGGPIPDHRSFDDAALALHINQLAISGDPGAVNAYEALARYLAEGIANIFNLFDPEAVLISGGLVEGQAQFVSSVAEQVSALLHFGCKRKPCVKAATSGRLAGVQGAATLVFGGQR